jgi:hypothetical protein
MVRWGGGGAFVHLGHHRDVGYPEQRITAKVGMKTIRFVPPPYSASPTPFKCLSPGSMGGSLLDSAQYHGPARVYCGRSPARELAEDPAPKTCPRSCMLASTVRPGLTISSASSCSKGPAQPC